MTWEEYMDTTVSPQFQSAIAFYREKLKSPIDDKEFYKKDISELILECETTSGDYDFAEEIERPIKERFLSWVEELREIREMIN